MRINASFVGVGLSAVIFCGYASLPSNPGAAAPSADHHGWLGTETIKTRFGEFDFKGGYPTPESAQALHEQLMFNRAVEIYLTQLPAVSIIETRKGVLDFGAKRANQVVVWEQLLDAQTLVLTANTETVYSNGFL